jgi:hypothetical protein
MSKGLHGGADRMTFATAIDLDFDGVSREVDLLALHADERMQETHRPPQLVISETKSLGRGELITAKGLAKLRSLAAKLPEAVIVIAVLRDHFTVAEKKILAKGQIVGRQLVVTSRDSTTLLDLIEESFDQVARSIEIRAKADRLVTITSRRDVSPSALLSDKPSDPIGVITPVCQQH